MTDSLTYISKEIAEKINDTAEVLEVVGHFLKLKKKGKDHVGDCPSCGAKGKFSISAAKDVWKCWACDESGKGAASPKDCSSPPRTMFSTPR